MTDVFSRSISNQYNQRLATYNFVLEAKALPRHVDNPPAISINGSGSKLSDSV